MIKELTPSSIKELQHLVDTFDVSFENIKDKIINVLIYSRIDEITDENLLDLLAWQFHIEGYEKAQDIQEKRNIIKNAIELHKYKGTLFSIKTACKIAGSKLIRARTPEIKTYLTLSLTDEDRVKFYQLFPEIRFTKFSFPGKKYQQYQKDFLSAKLHTCNQLAINRYGYRAYLVKKDIFQPLKTYTIQYAQKEKTAEEKVEVRKEEKAYGSFTKSNRLKYLINQNAKERLYTINLPVIYNDYEPITRTETITPSTEPITSKYEILQEKGKANYKTAFIHYVKGHTTDLDAEKRIWKRFKLFDPDVIPQRRNAYTFLDEKPIRIPPYNAEILIDVKDKVYSKFFYKFLIATSKKALHETQKLINDYKSVRDKIFIDTKTKRIPIADGTITAGQAIKIQEVINV
jgi:hypothetical protein